MYLKNRVGTFFLFCGALALVVFWASLQTPGKPYALVTLLAAATLIAVGWSLRSSKPPAGSERPDQVVILPKRPGPLSGLGRKPPPPPPPSPPPPPAAPKKSGLALFKSKPEKATGSGKPAAGQQRSPGGPKSR